jgi:hypothetical protein
MKKSKIKFVNIFPSTMKVYKINVDLNSWKLEIPVSLLTKDKTDFSDSDSIGSVMAVACENIIYNEKVLFEKNEKIPYVTTGGNNIYCWQDWNSICFHFHKSGFDCNFNKSLLKNKNISIRFQV